MMTMAEITKALGCGRAAAPNRLKAAGIERIRVASSNGVRYLYKVTPEELLEIKNARKPTGEEIIEQQEAALKMLDALFCRPPQHHKISQEETA